LGFIAAGAPIEPYTDPNAAISIPSTFVTGRKELMSYKLEGNQ
jgi:hypothetical protein